MREEGVREKGGRGGWSEGREMERGRVEGVREEGGRGRWSEVRERERGME